MPISKPHSTLGATNTSSCVDLALYLEKENNELDRLQQKAISSLERMAIEKRKQFFFTHSKDNISTNEVISAIDSNIKKLGKKDAKYFAPTLNFSQQELKHILSRITDKKEIKNIWDLNQEEYKFFNSKIKAYARIVMTNYAKNFNREDKGLKTGKDLVYYAKIEHFRKFKGTDPEVVEGLFKNGDYKPGLQSHAHIIVGRKDKTQRLKLTPTTKERSTTRSIGGNTYHVGFDRMNWINMNEKSFDEFFKYKRPEREKFKNQYILKNGSPKEKEALMKKIEKTIEKLTKQSVIKTREHDQNNTYNTPKRRGR
ncbi:DUF5712 family protein [Formosa algae]|uniref:Mobilization protein n=1 Tax=Formosa algae TaxID=225843 RepID=A0A9X1CA85_9FLAO|nr:DUF5712 family protein [Formosa algae]MBP1838637.1 hypothetical protein [Formosa algae]MDQ0335137.1 hypothetical protein [Formosa algae]OEI80388.1 hypothetical protein AST99_09280 [Formosa algae]